MGTMSTLIRSMEPPQRKVYVSPRGHTCVIIRQDDQHIVVLYTDKDNPNHQWEWAMKRSHFEKNYKEVIRLGDAFKVQGTLTPVQEKIESTIEIIEKDISQNIIS